MTTGRDLQPKRPGQQNFIKRAVFTEGRLWLLADSGTLSSIADGGGRRTEEPLPQGALDLCVRDGAPAVVACGEAACPAWTVTARTSGQWATVASVPNGGDSLVALACAGDELTLVSNHHIFEVRGGKTHSVALDEELTGRGVTSVRVEKDSVYVGVNAGEWGGGLLRLDRRTGRSTTIERNASGKLCGGPLNASCDPVNGIAPEPWRPGCVAAAVGLVHFSPHGRLVEICGDDVKRIYFKAYRPDAAPSKKVAGDEPFETVAFFGLVRQGDDLWATGLDGLYRLRAGKVVEVKPLPKFTTIDGVGVSFELPDLVLVVTMINQRLSISGGVPLLIPRQVTPAARSAAPR